MKKLLLSGFVVGSYILYSFHQRTDESSAVVTPSVRPASPAATVAGSTSTPAPSGSGLYKDGQYTGPAADANYGYIQVKVTISGGKLSNVVFLQYPNDRPNSVRINSQAMPYLKQEAIQAQSANVDGVSGATDTSQAFIQSLASALKTAQST